MSTPEVTPAPHQMDRLAAVYIRMRDKIAVLQKAFDTEVEGIKEQQQLVANAMKDQLQALGVESARTESGTVSLTSKTRYYPQDWASLKAFIMENDAIDLLEKRIAQTNMAKYLEENPDNLPIGLATTTTIEVSVRKPTKG